MKNLTSGLASRRLALEVLIKIDQESTFVNVALDQGFKRTKLSTRDRAFVTALVFGVIRNKSNLDQKIAALSSRPLKKLPTKLLNVLRLGIFQLDAMDDIPPPAVLFTCGELAKLIGHIGHSRFANGLLRKYLSNKSEAPVLDTQDQANDDQAKIGKEHKLDFNVLANQYSMPAWMVERWANTYGIAETSALLKHYQSTPPAVLRICQNSIATEDFKDILDKVGISYRVGDLVKSCLILNREEESCAPQELPGYGQGFFAIQDEPSAFISLVVDPQPREFIVDLCAGPGGKTLHLAELMHNSGQVVAVEKTDKRLRWLRDNRGRFKLTNVQLLVADGSTVELPRLADRVLLDAPCSGTGVLDRRPDLRYRLSLTDIEQLVALQRKLLVNAAKLVKPGGVLVYSTCSIESEENIENIKWFLANHKNFHGTDLTSYIPEQTLDKWSCAEIKEQGTETIKEQIKQGFLQLLPSRHNLSGFFVAKMRASI